MKQLLLMIAVVMGQSVMAADVVINDPIVRDEVARMLNKPRGKFAPPLKLTESDLAKVTHLGLYGTKITDACLKDVVKLQNLTTLLLGDQITDEGLKEVAKLQKLTTLDLGETKITDENAAELKKALPKLKDFSHSYKKD